MNRFAVLLILLLPMPAMAQSVLYELNPGDILEISVWKEEGLERQVLVLPDGMISFPLAGHIQAAGRTAEEVQKALTDRIKQYIPEPVITVSVPSVAGNKVYVIGQVNRPGEYPALHRIDVMQALSLAGGLTPFADQDGIKILRRETTKQVAYPFDYSAIEDGIKLELNIVLKSGDIVVVPD